MKKSKQEIKINLQMFADPEPKTDDEIEDELLDELGIKDEEETDVESDAETETGKNKDKDDWFLPGVAKTQKEALKSYKKNQQYIKQLEMKIKESQKTPQKQEAKQEVDVSKMGVIDRAMKELGITDDDLIVDPVGSQKKLLEHTVNVLIPQTVTQPLLNQTGNVRAEILKDKLRTLYPNFDIEKHEDKLANIVRSRYSPNYIQRNPLKVFSLVIEEFGGKKNKGKTSTTDGETFTETPTPGDTATAGKQLAKQIRERILKAEVGKVDLFS